MMNFLRKWRSKGHGIHSPFAYHLVRNVIRSPHTYYAFSDIEEILCENGWRDEAMIAFNQQSFRLVHHFKPKKILEINHPDEINIKFIAAACENVRCICLNVDELKTLSVENETFDAIFIYSQNVDMPTLETLVSLSHNETFWVTHSIKDKQGKRFWQNALKYDHVRVAFDLTETGIIFLNPALHKLNYYI